MSAWLICFMTAAVCPVLLLDTLPSISYYFYLASIKISSGLSVGG